MSWFAWLFRGQQRDRAYSRLHQLRTEYAAHGEQVIKLSARTELLRKSAGATQRSFDHVESTFAAASTEFARLSSLLDALEAGLARGQVGDFHAAETAVRELGPRFGELDRLLSAWEARWHQVPLRAEQAERLLAEQASQVAAVAETLRGELPVARRVQALQSHLARARAALAGGDPVEAEHLLADFDLAYNRAVAEVSQYLSGANAIVEVESVVADLEHQVASTSPSEAVEALAAARALLPRLRTALLQERLEQFQQDLLQVQRHLSRIRSALRA